MDSNFSQKERHLNDEEECLRAEAARQEFLQQGRAEKRCVRCGEAYVFEELGSGYIVRYETPRCFLMTVRETLNKGAETSLSFWGGGFSVEELDYEPRRRV